MQRLPTRLIPETVRLLEQPTKRKRTWPILGGGVSHAFGATLVRRPTRHVIEMYRRITCTTCMSVRWRDSGRPLVGGGAHAGERQGQARSWDSSPQHPSVSAQRSRRPLESGSGIWSGREDLNLDSFPGREACCNYTTSAKPASVEPDTFPLWTTSRTVRTQGATPGPQNPVAT